MSDRLGVEIDYCPKCRGIWLDRGELDKIIERSERDDDGPRGGGPPPAPPQPPQHPQQPQHRPPAYPPGYDPNDDSKYGYPYKPHKKKSVWREILDF